MDSRPPTRSVPSRGNLRHHSNHSREGHPWRLRSPAGDHREPRQRRHPWLPARRRGLPQDAARRHGDGRPARAPRSPPSVTPAPPSAPTARPSTPTSRPPPRPATAWSTRRSSRSPRRAWTSSKPRWAADMGLFDALDASGSALSAERVRMDVTAENLANAQSTRTANGQGPYRRKEVVLQEAGAGVGSRHLRRLPATPPAASRSPASSRTPRRRARSTTPGTPTPTPRATCRCPTSTPSPR